MDEQIKPVAWIMPSALKALHRGGVAMVGPVNQGADEPLYPQQSIDALRAELAEQCRLHAIGMERELALIGRADRAEADAAAKQARIDELMLEYCPDEMTPEQIENWKRHQVPAIDAARKGE